MVYLADHPSTALLETIVHFNRAMLPSTFQLLAIDAMPSLETRDAELPTDWQNRIDLTQRIGQQFLEDGVFSLLRVPSVVMPQAFNYLLNPNHPDAAKLTIAQIWRYPFDSRLLM